MNIEAIMKPLREFLSKMTKGQKIRFAILGVVLIALVAIAVVLMSRTDYVVLYTGMDAAEAGQVYNTLSANSEDVKLEGTTIKVPAADRDRILLDMASQGIPKSGRTYDILNSASGMGSTDAEKDVMFKIQLQENLSKTIKSMVDISDAAVTLNIPKSSNMIKSEIKKSTASVYIEVKGGERLAAAKAKTIAQLVASSAGIEATDVFIADAAGNSYNTNSESGVEAATEKHQMEDNVRIMMQNRVLELLTPVYGENNVQATVDAKLNFDDVLEQSVTFSPPDGAEDLAGLRASRRELTERVGAGSAVEGNPGMDSNGASVPEYPETLDDDGSDYFKQEIETNYELNEVKEEIKKAKGGITSLTVSVLINGALDVDDYMTDVRTLVANGLGVDEEYIEVRSIPFTDNSEEIAAAKAEYEAQLRSVQMQKLIRTIIIVVGILAAIFLIVKLLRDISNNNLEAKRAQAEAVNKFSAAAKGEGGEDPGTIDTDKKSTERQQIEEFIDSSPELVAQLLRNWIADDAR